MTGLPRRQVLITGAAGGMGRACAQLFGATQDLILTDVARGPLESLAEDLKSQAYDVVAHAEDLGEEDLLDLLVHELSNDVPFTVIHTAGLSPALADWEAIMRVNLIASEKLLGAIESVLKPGCVAILIASSAGHMIPPLPQADAVLAEPLAPDFMDKVGAVIDAMGAASSPGGAGGISYSLSKRAIHAICQSRALEWGPRGARIVSISPGMILTSMGRAELARTPGGQQLLDNTPVGWGGTSMDIALAAQFLASEAATFITGADLLVDGGGTAGMKRAMAAK